MVEYQYLNLFLSNGILIISEEEEVMDILSIQQKIEIACRMSGITQSELAKRLGTSAPAWNKRLKTGKFSDEDFQNIAEALGCQYKSGFYFSDGNKVE